MSGKGLRKWIATILGTGLLVLGAVDGVGDVAPTIEATQLVFAGGGLITVGAGGQQKKGDEK